MTSRTAIAAKIQRCQCDACRDVQHASYCAVHNAPALPIGECTCHAEGLVPVAEGDIVTWYPASMARSMRRRDE